MSSMFIFLFAFVNGPNLNLTWESKRTIGKCQKLQCICVSEGIQPSEIFEKEPREKKEQKHRQKNQIEKKTLTHTPLKLWFQNYLPNHVNHVCLMNQNALFTSTTKGFSKSPITHPKVLINKFLRKKLETNCFKKKHGGPRTSHCACSLREPELQLSSWVDSL